MQEAAGRLRTGIEQSGLLFAESCWSVSFPAPCAFDSDASYSGLIHLTLHCKVWIDAAPINLPFQLTRLVLGGSYFPLRFVHALFESSRETLVNLSLTMQTQQSPTLRPLIADRIATCSRLITLSNWTRSIQDTLELLLSNLPPSLEVLNTSFGEKNRIHEFARRLERASLPRLRGLRFMYLVLRDLKRTMEGKRMLRACRDTGVQVEFGFQLEYLREEGRSPRTIRLSDADVPFPQHLLARIKAFKMCYGARGRGSVGELEGLGNAKGGARLIVRELEETAGEVLLSPEAFFTKECSFASKGEKRRGGRRRAVPGELGRSSEGLVSSSQLPCFLPTRAMPPKASTSQSTPGTLSLPALLKLLTSSPRAPLTTSQAIAAASKLVPAGYTTSAKLATLNTQVDMAKIGIEDPEIRKGLMQLFGKEKKGGKRKRGSDMDRPLPTKEVVEVVQTNLEFDEIHAEEVSGVGGDAEES